MDFCDRHFSFLLTAAHQNSKIMITESSFYPDQVCYPYRPLYEMRMREIKGLNEQIQLSNIKKIQDATVVTHCLKTIYPKLPAGLSDVFTVQEMVLNWKEVSDRIGIFNESTAKYMLEKIQRNNVSIEAAYASLEIKPDLHTGSEQYNKLYSLVFRTTPPKPKPVIQDDIALERTLERTARTDAIIERISECRAQEKESQKKAIMEAASIKQSSTARFGRGLLIFSSIVAIAGVAYTGVTLTRKFRRK